MRFATVSILMFALLASCTFAYVLNLQVTGVQGTVGVGTNISIIKDGVPLYFAKANSYGNASFNLTGGSYFIQLNRSGYPTHMLLVDITSDSTIKLSMRQLISYANVYGFISGPSDFTGAYVSAYQGGKVIGRVAADRNGYYLLSYLPSGTYDLLFEAPGFANYTKNAYLTQPLFTEENVVLLRQQKNTTPQGPVTLLVPSQTKIYSTIEIMLLIGDAPYPNQKVSVSTPAGVIEVITDSEGKARVNAASEGKYEFSYGGVKSSSKVASPTPAAQNNTAPPVIEQQPAPEPAAPQQQDGQQNGLLLVLGAIAAVAVVAVSIIVLAVLFKNAAKKHAPEAKPPAAEEKPAQPHAHAHKAHQHAHHEKKQ